MRDKARQLVLIACATVMAGCAMSRERYGPWGRSPADDLRPMGVNQRLLQEFNAAVALVAEQRYQEAAANFNGIFQAFEAGGDEDGAAESMFWIGFCQEKQQRGDQARDLYKRLISKYPETPAARQAAERLARLPAGLRR